MGFIQEYERALAGDDTQHYIIAGVQLRCGHCGGQDFDRGRALLNTVGLTFLGLDWANREANVLTCTRCGEVRWFLEEPERI